MTCTQIHEGSDSHTWGDNYFCSDIDRGFRRSSAGPIAGMTCLPWAEPADPHTWEDNFLCWRYTAPAVDAGTSARDVPASIDRGAPSTDRGSPATDLGADVVLPQEDVNLPDDAGTVDVFTWDAGPAQGSDGGFVDDLPPVEDVSLEPHLTEGEAGPDCGCAVPGRRGGRGPVWLVLPLWALVRRRQARGG